ncbi:P-loop containing nucleoside triphosphate hydrolase protein [Hymenopellis radicata]|nr:P-loop containing nucleoside triphosphate hydrolase protein [Hymenopellis radicata]
MPESDTEAQDMVEKAFGVRPCLWQLKVVRAILDGNDVVTIAPTGAGKTLTYWMVLLFAEGGVVLMVVPLKQLGAQFEADLMLKKLNAINVTAKNSGEEVFKDIVKGKYRAAIFSPETMVGNPHFEDLLKNRTFMRNVVNLVFDEAHVIKEWGMTFRQAYARAGVFRNLMVRHVPIHIASATLSPAATEEIKAHLRMRNNTKVFRMNIDRPNIYLRVKRMQHPANSFRDLADFVPKDIPPDGPRPKKFLMFFNGRKQAQAAAEFLRARLPKDQQHRIKWVHAGMTDEFRKEELYLLKVGEVDGECATEAVGLGIDLPDVYQIIQYGVPKSLSTWWQRAGRAVRDYKLNGTAILLAEPSYFDDEKAKAATKKAEAEKERLEQEELHRKAIADAIAAAQAAGTQPTNSRKRKLTENKSSRKRKKTTETIPEIRDKDVFGQEIKIEQSMDDFINAENRVVRCRRRVVLTHFGSVNLAPIVDKDCCTRCAPKTAEFCCDICHPTYWNTPPAPDVFAKETGSRMYNPAAYERGEKEEKLRKELDLVRRRLWAKEVGPGKMITPQSLWPTKLLSRMVDLAHYGKLQSLEDLRKQTPWFFIDDVGSEILAKIKEDLNDSNPDQIRDPSREYPWPKVPIRDPYVIRPATNRRIRRIGSLRTPSGSSTRVNSSIQRTQIHSCATSIPGQWHGDTQPCMMRTGWWQEDSGSQSGDADGGGGGVVMVVEVVG